MDQATSAHGLAVGEPESVGLSSQCLARIRPLVQAHIDRRQIPGAVTLVARRGKIAHFEALGMMNIEAGKPMQRDTIFRIASMTKPITSVAVMMLQQEGHLLLTDPISKFIPEFKNPKVALPPTSGQRSDAPFVLTPAEREITIRDLLTHTAGLANGWGGITLNLYLKMA